MEIRHPDIVSTLFAGSDKNTQVEVLVSLMLDLLMEVEALRKSLIQIDDETRGMRVNSDSKIGYHDQILSWGKSAYQKAYLETAYETHHNGGPSGGLDKLLARFYPPSSDEMGRAWRECLLLQRMGFSESEIAEYKKAAEEAEMFT